ncbi:outer membrane beta-barrel family protein [Zobellia russellii]|uniref:outer membrane beta-barrel family protein n=1 Tax=Zobellia russellii TaxID=248907 RepID=UPI001BFFBD58|nr:outer membrane beta-barrel family protein [Zobellia russellii]MBT9190267.1 outer membrane beta-barrel protein [Zobellia russellii]
MIVLRVLRTILFTLLFVQTIYAQQGKLNGNIIDDNKGPVAFANVLLLQKDSVLVKGVISNQDGFFILDGISNGNYLLNINLLGFESIYKKVSFNYNEELSLGSLTLNTQSQQLDEVAVVGRKALFEQRSDRLVVNVGSLPTFSGNNALQVLQKAPGVIVQENSNSISLSNKGQVLIMINNRISRIPRAALLQQLKGMQAENIERIELIHQPSAKYDANNAAGIIHIVLKENNFLGLNGNTSLTAGIGKKEKFNGSFDLNYRNNRVNIYGNITGVHSRSPMWFLKHYREYEYLGDQYFYYNKLTAANPSNPSLGVTLGVDVEVNSTSTIGALFGYTKSNMSGYDYASISNGTVNAIQNENSQYILDINNPNRNTFFNLNYYSQLSPNKSINIDLDRVALDVQNFSGLSYVNPSEEIDSQETERNSQFEIYTVKGDFEWESEDHAKLQTGLKATFNNSNSALQNRNRINGVWTEDQTFRRDDQIGETILAAYGSYQKKWNEKWESSIGARLENYKYELDDTVDGNDFSTDYTNLFPVARTTYTVDSTRTLTLSFNRRIERPAFFHLAAFYLLIDPSLLVSTNTRLRPAFTDAVRLAYNQRSFLVAFEVNRTKGAISFYNTVDKEQGLQTSTPINFDNMNGYLLSTSFPIKISKIWKMNWNLDGAYKKVKDYTNRPLPFKKGLFTLTAQLNNVFELGNSLTANIDGRYMSPFISGDQIQFQYHSINFGVSKRFGNESTLTFSIQDLTATGGKDEWEYHQPELGIRTYGDNDFSERVFQLTYSFPFGNKKIKEKRSRQTGSQEERDRM